MKILRPSTHTVFGCVALLFAWNASAEEATEASETEQVADDATEARETEEKAEEGTSSQSQDKPAQANSAEKSLSFIIPESAALPKNVMRFRTIYGSSQSQVSYDAKGKELPETGFELTANGLAFAFEYGLTSKISAQVLVPWSLGGDVKLVDEDKFKQLEAVQTGVAAAVDSALAGLRSQLVSNFGAGWDANVQTPQDIVDPSTGDVLIPAGTPIQDGFNGVRNAAIATGLEQAVALQGKAQEVSRAEGLGDIEVGARYSFSSVSEPLFEGVPLFASLALGVRFNSSDYLQATEEGKLPAGRGTNDLGLRANVDYEPIRGLQFQVENQSEVMLSSGKAYTAPKSAGGSEEELKREGMRQIGFAKIAFGPGAFYDPVRFLTVSVRYNWDNDPGVKVGDGEAAPLQVKRALQYGAALEGLNYGLPAQLEYNYISSLPSPNTQFALDSHQVQLKLYYRF